MSMMLSLIQAGWESVRTAASQGRRADALTQVTQLLSRPTLPPDLAAEAHRLAGELATEAERYPQARRHLRAAAALEPTSARTHYMLGLALERDPQGCDRRAAARFQQAAKLENENCLYRAAFGRAAIRSGRTKTGVRVLLEAVQNAPGEIAVLRVAVDGFLEAGQLKAAQRALTQARFMRPGDRELATMWERTRFETARREQRELGGTTRHRQDAEHAKDGGRVVLPFVRIHTQNDTRQDCDSILRLDMVSQPQPHFPRLRVQGRR
ncbi:MAG: tetratricopeptide repeat protein [Planctomycetes bacterium]|nr:tetratricopeptide repeat protein [Planctomycetota bacterium]